METLSTAGAPTIFDHIINGEREKRAERLDALAEQLKFNRLHYWRPYGHDDTFIGGEIWSSMQKDSKYRLFLEKIGLEAGIWEEWSEKQWQLSFANASQIHQEMMVACANRVGKTSTASYVVAMHMTGRYPDWYEGKRFDKPVLVWTGSPTNETSRDIVQKALLGGLDKETKGSGSIPRDALYGTPKTRQAGVSNVVDVFKVRHVSGGISECIMKTYEQGWRKWQGTQPEIVWLDEEPEDNEVQGKIYSEALTRLLTSHGLMFVTFTPLLGVTKLVKHYQDGGKGIYLDGATWEDVPHLNREERERLASSYMDFEKEARTMGIPMMGEGAIFQCPESTIKVKPFDIPSHFALLKGVDFGIDHPAACADIAWDRDNDVIYVTRVWRKKGADISEHAEAINRVNPWVPVAWPHDGLKRQSGKSGNVELKRLYEQKNVRLLSRSARYDKNVGGAQAQWPVIKEIEEREEEGRFKVFSTCKEYLEERRNYHTKDGKIVSMRDDILKSVFYAVMSKRYAMMNRHVRSHHNYVPQGIRIGH